MKILIYMYNVIEAIFFYPLHIEQPFTLYV